MAISIIQASFLCLVSYILWRVVRPFVVKSPLAHIPGPPSDHWWKGNFKQVFNREGWQFHADIVRKYGGVVKLYNLFNHEMLYVTDPLALHHIVVKDQYVYEETDAFIRTNALVFGPGLTATLGEQHKRHRKLLNPVFSLKHMRDLVPVLYPIAHQLRDVLTREVQDGEKETNVVKWISRAALEYISQGGIGYTFHSLDESTSDTGSTFSDAIKLISLTSFSLLLPRQFLSYVDSIGPAAFRRKVVEMLPSETLQRLRGLVDAVDWRSKEIFQKRKEAFLKGDETVKEQVGQGKDIMSVLLKANMMAEKENQLSDYELLGHMNTLIPAGQETTTGAICRVLHLLSLHSDVQARLREEVSSARDESGDLGYDTLMGLPYLDAVCRETLRVYPPVSQVVRTTREDIVMPLMFPIKSTDSGEVKEIAVKKNTDVIISIIGANRNKKVWGEDAEEWKPERWLGPLPDSVAKAHMPGVYASMMTFIGGGRACIGFKFAEMEMKMVLSVLLESFVFKPGPEIFWAMSMQASPVVKGQIDHTPQLPLRVTLARP